MKRNLFFFTTILLAVCAANGCKLFTHKSKQAQLPTVTLDLPHDVKNADAAPKLTESMMVVTIFGPLDRSDMSGKNDVEFLGDRRVFLSDLPSAIEAALKNDPEKTVYIKADRSVDYGEVVKVINEVREAGVINDALLVQGGVLQQFAIQVPQKRDWEDFLSKDISKLKPDPKFVGVMLRQNLQIELVNGGYFVGMVGPPAMPFQENDKAFADKSSLTQALSQTLQGRTNRTVTIKSVRANRYDDVIKLIDAVKGAGGNPIVLQIDDLP